MLAIEFGVERVHFHLRHLRAAMRVDVTDLKTRARRARGLVFAVSEARVQRKDTVDALLDGATCVEYGYLRGERVSGSDGRAAALRPAGTDDRAIL